MIDLWPIGRNLSRGVIEYYASVVEIGLNRRVKSSLMEHVDM
jgi:hypothetical protein